MFGPKITTVFRSRWNALVWSCFILLTAYCSVPDAEETKANAARQEQAHSQANPWAKQQDQGHN